MDDAGFSPNTMLGTLPDSLMDIEYMDGLLLEGCWLETMCGSEFLPQSPPFSNAIYDPLFSWSSLDDNKGQGESNGQHEMQTPSIPANSQSVSPSMTSIAEPPSQIENNPIEANDLRRRWWIGPRVDTGPSTSVMGRLIKALGYIQDLTKDKDVLIQLWVPVNRGGKRVLTTSEQPFALESNSRSLSSYRNISVNYQFSAEEDSKEMVGLPSRVFLGKVPEWTPDVRFFRSDEYPRVNHAQQFDVSGTLALPVFEQGSRTCLGVIEVVMTTQKIQYRPEIENVCKALKAVDLRSSEVCGNPNVESCTRSYEAALPEIREVLRSACQTHRLPLAQTWVPCIQQGKAGCRHSDENYSHCVSTVDSACHVADSRVQGFHEACSEHHLLKGQGIVGSAFLTNQPCFSPDVTSIGKTDYPLSHHARMFGLCGAVAIRLRSIYTGTADFVLEFFLPVECKDHEEQKQMLSSLSNIIQQVCQNLRVVSEEELQKESTVSLPSGLPREESLEGGTTGSENNFIEDSSWSVGSLSKAEKTGKSVMQKGRGGKIPVQKTLKFRQQQLHGSESGEDCLVFDEGSFPGAGMAKLGDRKRAKAEKSITLQVLRQYFAGSLKDAAKSLGVCPTTLKRICRQHGIMRWPSRKIKKVGHSLQKLQLVMDSVQGTSGSLQIDSFYSKFPELTSPNISTSGPLPSTNLSDPQQPSSIQPVSGNIEPHSAASKSPSSSCSHSSSSSQCCSSGRQQLSSPWTLIGREDHLVSEDDPKGPKGMLLKRVRSEVELQSSSPEETKVLPRSQSHKILNDDHNFGSAAAQPVSNYGSKESQEWEAMRVKVTYGDEIIRFRLQNKWGLNDLWQEIRRRFNVDNPERYDLKYLDDDMEWVLLTCDADLEECVDVSRSSQNSTIRLSLQLSHHHLGSSFGSSGPP